MSARNNRRVGRGFDDDEWLDESDVETRRREKEALKAQRRAANKATNTHLEELNRPVKE